MENQVSTMFRKIIILLIIASPCVLSRNHELWKNSDVVNDLSWLFDIEQSKEKIKHGVKTNTVCETDGCKYLSKLILKGMNKTVDPCDDFYKYVCGQWNSETRIPPHESNWGHTQMFQAAVYDRLKEILETKPEPSDILPVRQAKKWYRACMNMNDLEKRGIKPLESILMQIGGWPMTMDEEEWDENNYSWQNIERYYFRLTGSYIFYDMALDSRMMIISGKIPLADDFPGKYRNYTGNDYRVYSDLIQGVVREFVEHNKANIEPDVIEKNVRDVVEFEKKIYMLDQGAEHGYERESVGDLVKSYQKSTDNFDASGLINLRLMIEDYFALGNVKINDSFRVESFCRSYLKDLTKLLSETPKKTIINYLHWHFISNMLHFTSEKLRELLFKLKEVKYGVKERPPRWYECVQEIRMEHATSYAFVQKYFSKKAESTALEMIEHIRTEMESQIDSSNWMDDESKELIIEKLNTMQIFLGFPDWYRNKTAVINAYKGLTIGTNYIDNVLNFQRYSAKIKVQRLKNMNFEEEPWLDVRPTIVNAFYSPGENTINLPAADFQPPLFTPHLPDNINYGIVGAVVGHEIGHAFDDSGIKYGIDGDRTQLPDDWMELYFKRAECFLDQFNEYYGVTEPIYEGTTPDVIYGDFDKISAGRRTRGENIADTTGLHSAFEAYKKMLQKRSHPDLKLPGFEAFSDEQMFFIAFSVSWCEVVRPEYAKQAEKEDPHSSSHLRVIGTVSNTNDFAKAFKCPRGSPMNPDNKCNIWKTLSEDEHALL